MKEEKDQSVERKPVVEITYDTPYELLPETGNPRYPTKRVIECERCGKLFVPRSPRTRFCDDCRVIHEREKARERWIKNGKKLNHTIIDLVYHSLAETKAFYVNIKEGNN